MPPTFTILIDNGCPLCRTEGAFLQRLDRSRGRLRVIDISAPGFDSAPLGVDMDQLMGSIHGFGPDGRMISGVGVFRGAYAAVGLGWLLAPTAWPIVRPLADAAYRFFARHRLRLTGRAACQAGSCRV